MPWFYSVRHGEPRDIAVQAHKGDGAEKEHDGVKRRGQRIMRPLTDHRCRERDKREPEQQMGVPPEQARCGIRRLPHQCVMRKQADRHDRETDQIAEQFRRKLGGNGGQ